MPLIKKIVHSFFLSSFAISRPVFKKPAETKKSAPSNPVGFLKKSTNLVKPTKIYLIQNVNSEIPNRRMSTDFADKSTEFTDKPAE
jgi:hypothetical protein